MLADVLGEDGKVDPIKLGKLATEATSEIKAALDRGMQPSIESSIKILAVLEAYRVEVHTWRNRVFGLELHMHMMKERAGDNAAGPGPDATRAG